MTEPIIALSDEDVVRLLPALAEAERATEMTAMRFVPPRPGILEEVSAKRHQLVYGRRGVESRLLRRVAATGPESGGPSSSSTSRRCGDGRIRTS